MEPYFSTHWGNPSSIHSLGRKAKQAVEHARTQLADALGTSNSEVIFTSGATEGNNAVLHSAIANQTRRGHVLTTGIEHASILEACDQIGSERISVHRLPVDRNGQFDWERLQELLPGAALFTTSWANNETGVLSDVDRLAALCTEHGVPLHLDAAQAFGKIPISLESLNIAYLTISAHKVGGPKGVGALVIRADTSFVPLIVGGSQENARRSGTENVTGIVGFGAAATIASLNAPSYAGRVGPLRDLLEAELKSVAAETLVAGSNSIRLANTSNVALPIEDAAELIIQLDQRGICVSAGSACHAGSIEPSHVLLAMGLSRERARRSIRFSLGLGNTRAELDTVIQAVKSLLAACSATSGS